MFIGPEIQPLHSHVRGRSECQCAENGDTRRGRVRVHHIPATYIHGTPVLSDLSRLGKPTFVAGERSNTETRGSTRASCCLLGQPVEEEAPLVLRSSDDHMHDGHPRDAVAELLAALELLE